MGSALITLLAAQIVVANSLEESGYKPYVSFENELSKCYKKDYNKNPFYFDDSKIISKAEEKRKRKALKRLQNENS